MSSLPPAASTSAAAEESAVAESARLPLAPGAESGATASVKPALSLAPASPPPERSDRGESVGLDGHQIFFLFVGSALAACLIFALGVTVGRRIEQRAAAQQKATPADPLAMLDEIANAEEALTFHRAVLERAPWAASGQAGAASAPSDERAVRYTLQSPTFAQRPAAEELLRRLREAGYKVKVVETPVTGQQKPIYRLQIGDFGTSEGAQPIRSDLLQRFGLATSVTRLAPVGQPALEPR
jgi:cell division septation protein DedD